MTHNNVRTYDEAGEGWYKSSFSNSAGGSCVEVKRDQGQFFVRDSKDKRADQPIIGVGSASWAAFLSTLS
ncbi:DUF397 domain-containing protein [Kibdelosporangium phytohabitans]|uniref:DUF397 domain-containing protein n=1 Tax=Kibdelosporangium phytohabitans TaxID=860235 RepID=A0A0N9HSY2_9PSEU|nr:DUF397 domain-containing protein [Kibdelosporangium phytohabitans]ALG08056.1 hypothetical protein AOZ06_15035 [Kibdelosporangium phytohabitans]MBE1470975.1 hypothetical protein [Kibdelosporangium phytohabitans]